MNILKEMKEKRGLLEKEIDDLAVKIENETITEAEEARLDEIITEIEGLRTKIEASEKREKFINSRTPGILINPVKTDNEKQAIETFRFVKLINTLAANKPLEGFYAEMDKEGRQNMQNCGIRNIDDGYVVPAFIIGGEQRDMTTSTSDTAKAGYTIATELLASQWIDVLKNSLVVTGMGARFMKGLQGNIPIPKKTANSGAAWLTETGSITAADSTWGNVTMSPKRLGNAMAFSRQLLVQSSLDVENIVREDLIISQSLALQDAIIHGAAGGNNPVGILNTSGIGSVAIGTNGGALTWAKVVELETSINTSNALLGNLQYLSNSKVWGALKVIEKASNTGIFLMNESGYLNGYKIVQTNAVPSTLSKGNSGAVCSALIYGNWSDLMIGQWGGLVITANPYALDLSGQVRVTMNSYYDVAVRQAASFAAIKDITTS